MKIKKYSSRKNDKTGGRRKSKKNTYMLSEISGPTNKKKYNNTESMENISIQDPKSNDASIGNLNDINNTNLLISQQDIEKISEKMPTFKLDNYKYDLLNSNPEIPTFYDTLQKNTIKVLDRRY